MRKVFHLKMFSSDFVCWPNAIQCRALGSWGEHGVFGLGFVKGKVFGFLFGGISDTVPFGRLRAVGTVATPFENYS